MAKRITFTVTNDLNYDQRMIRICSSLQQAGYEILLIGRKRASSLPLKEQAFQQKRLYCFFDKGKLFYAEYNLRLFLFLLFVRTDCFGAIDLDTILPNLFASKLRRKNRVYDAHELFCEMEEIVSRPRIYKAWKMIERYAVPQFKHGYTIGTCYAEEFERMYQVQYEIVRNATVLKPFVPVAPSEKYILYQGAVNEGRSFETLIPAMKQVACKLIICGEGNYFQQAKELARIHALENKIEFKGYLPPSELINYTRNAYIGITLFTNQGKSNYFSMANRFFDYMHAGIPQVCVAFPEYQKANSMAEIAVLVQDTQEETIAMAINKLLEQNEFHQQLSLNCLQLRAHFCWQEEEKKLIRFYYELFQS